MRGGASSFTLFSHLCTPLRPPPSRAIAAGTSPYACIVLPREAGRSLLPYYTFEFDPLFERRLGLSPAKLQRRFEEWQGAFTHVLKKASVVHVWDGCGAIVWGMNMSGVRLPLACFLHAWQLCSNAQASDLYVPHMTAAPDPP